MSNYPSHTLALQKATQALRVCGSTLRFDLGSDSSAASRVEEGGRDFVKQANKRETASRRPSTPEIAWQSLALGAVEVFYSAWSRASESVSLQSPLNLPRCPNNPCRRKAGRAPKSGAL